MTSLSRHELDIALGLTLTDEQWDVVSCPLAPAVIVAGAGSGKTTSMAARVAWLVGSGLVRPEAVIGLTFTTKAAGQLLTSMRTSIQRLVEAGIVAGVDDDGDPLGEPEVLTYHAFAARILAEHGIRIGREPRPVILTEESRQQLAYRFVCRSTLPLADLARDPATLTSDLLSLDDELAELAITPEELRRFDDDLAATLRAFDVEKPLQAIGREMLATSTLRGVLADLVREWRADKAAREVMDFADQIRLAGHLVQRFPEVVADLRARYGVVLLDEYQDTSIAQRTLLQQVFGEGHPVLAVGDPCQAIYGWRGASVDNIENFPDHFPGASGRADRFALSLNRRSGPNVLALANRTSERLRTVHAGVQPLGAGDNGKGPGAVSCALFSTYDDEVAWVVDQVVATHEAGARWRDIAILGPTGRDLIRVQTVLRRRGVPTQLVGAAALLAQPAVVDLRAMLELIHDPCANAAFVRLASGPRWRIGARDLAALGERANELAGGHGHGDHPDLATALDAAVAGSDVVDVVSLSEALADPGAPERYSAEAFQRFAAMADELDHLRRLTGEQLPELLLQVMRTTGLEVEVSLLEGDDGAQQMHALHAFVDLASGFTDVDGRIGLGAFLSRLRDAERFDVDLDLEVGGPADAVSLLTVHKAKGLEFPYVFVPFVSEDAFPGGNGRSQWPTSAKVVPWPMRPDADAALAGFPIPGETPRDKHKKAYWEVLSHVGELENDRLAYVAFTRAERGLAVTGHWWGPHQKEARGPARFLETVREACLAGEGQVVHWAPPPDDGETNPQRDRAAAPVLWPVVPDEVRRAQLLEVAQAVRSAPPVQPGLPGLAEPEADHIRRRIAEWDDLAAALVEEARARRTTDHVVRLPASVSASQLMRALADPQETARNIARPMPQQPSRAARRGTEFHAWVETRFGQQSLLDPEDLPGAADADIASDAALAELKAAFERSPYADREPVGVEVPFALVLGGRVVHGRIDAVFATASGYEVVDWKTGTAAGVDPMQLAIYRLAWAQRAGVSTADVDSAFLIVSTGEVLRPDTDVYVEQLLG